MSPTSSPAAHGHAHLCIFSHFLLCPSVSSAEGLELTQTLCWGTGLKVQARKSQSIHFHSCFTWERGKCLYRNNSLEQLPWLCYVTGMAQHVPLASNIWANALRAFAKLIVRVAGNTNKHMHKYSHGQMGHETVLFLQFSSIIWASLFISLTCCHLLLALLLQVTRPPPRF